ncbi:RyR domain-containing protein [Candidatus Latescibacterota bacterium]
MKYKPKPIDTSNVKLSKKLHELIELLSKNTHDNWAQKRIEEGWCYGPQRDDILKEHPCLVEYHKLSDSEKEYDRKSVTETLKTIQAKGYDIIQLGHQMSSDNALSENSYSEEITRINSIIRNPSKNNVYNLWLSRNPELWNSNPTLYLHLGERFLNLGEPLMAYDVLLEGMNYSHNDLRMKQLLSLSLARSGATEQANTILQQIYKAGNRDQETVGLFARTFKDLWLHTTDPVLKRDYLKKAFKNYNMAYRLTGGYWTGINAATSALLLGKKDKAVGIASKVQKYCISEKKQLKESDNDYYWLLATLGESALICENWSEAQEWYAQAAEQGRGRYGDLISTRKNAMLIIEYLDTYCGWIEEYFQIPKVAVFSGHMIDRQERVVPRFPLQLEHTVYNAIVKRLKELNVGFGYASASCGSDILFLEAILEVGGEANIVLPYNKEQFAKDCVDIIPGSDWQERYEQLFDRAAQVLTASNFKMDEESVYYHYANLLQLGLAKNRAKQFETDLVPMAVWDGKPGDRYGGTATNVEYWRKYCNSVEVIDLSKAMKSECIDSRCIPGDPIIRLQEYKSEQPQEFSQKITSILFADTVRFSKLNEKEVACYVKYFLGAISDLISHSSHVPEMKNTWGDALYLVFSNILNAGLFALDLCDLIESTNWTKKGLPESINLRIALHSGPVLSCVDPVIGAPTFTGTHVSHAARIEPVTPPGQVYASQAFAALASAENITEFTCEYVGQTPMAKKYGIFPTYRIRRY